MSDADDMSIEEVREEIQDLQQDLYHRIREFEEKTGVCVTDVEGHTYTQAIGDEKLAAVEVTVEP